MREEKSSRPTQTNFICSTSVQFYLTLWGQYFKTRQINLKKTTPKQLGKWYRNPHENHNNQNKLLSWAFKQFVSKYSGKERN